METYKWGRQPVADLIQRQGHTLQQISDLLLIPRPHLENVIYGRTRPRPHMIEALEDHFGLTRGDLFTPAVLSKPFDISKPGPGAGVVSKSHAQCPHDTTPVARRRCRNGQPIQGKES